MKKNILNSKKGFGLIEILIVTAIVSVGLLSIISFLIFSRGVTFKITRNTEAVSLAEESIEAARGIRDDSWAAISTLNNSTIYYPVISSGSWTLTTINPGLINNLYTRTVVLSSVSRDGNDDIVSNGGVVDTGTRKITSTVSWTENGKNEQVVLSTYITNFNE